MKRGVRARCGHCGATIAVLPGSGESTDTVRPAIIEAEAPARPRRGRWFLGFVTGAVVASVALYFVDRRTDLQSIDIEIDEAEVAATINHYWSRALDFFEAAQVVRPDPARREAQSVTAATEPAAAKPAGSTPAAQLPAAASPASEPQPTVEANLAARSSPALEPVPVEPGLMFNRTGKEELAPLAILTAPGRDYFVKLVDPKSKQPAVAIYVRGGEPADVTVPLGPYEMRYASGMVWYGPESLFGPETVYSKVGDVLNFREENEKYRGYTIELRLQQGGNLETVGISAEDF